MDRETPALDIALDKVCYVVAKAREFDVKVAPAVEAADEEEDAGAVLSAHADDPTYQELREFLSGLNEDELVTLVALAWLGRDEYDADDWPDVLQDARDSATPHAVDYLLGIPLLADHLENALSTLDRSCEDAEVAV